ncbi:sodium-translocating pyrophosphatase [Candidatus Bathyarchaeota archaeon]|nr:sodium-translocating pyrophosphatase [Candidatus Bathyarchaeota archaeon]
MEINPIFILTIISGTVSIVFALYLYSYVTKQDPGNERMKEVMHAIQEGASAFLKRQYVTMMYFVTIVAVVIGLLGFIDPQAFGIGTAVSYVIGSVASALAGIIGMKIATQANSRSAFGCQRGITPAFKVAFYAGSVMGLLVVGIALVGVSILYWAFALPEVATDENVLNILNHVLGYSFGASTIALFAKAGGGIYTKAADVGADLVGKVEANLPEDDPRNPAVIADNVGDNVGDVAGMGADIFDSYVASIVATMILGIALDSGAGTYTFVILPLIASAFGIFSSAIGLIIVPLLIKNSPDRPGKALNMGTYITTIVYIVFSGVFFPLMIPDVWPWIFLSNIAGLVSGVVIGITSDYYTDIGKPPVKSIAKASTTGSATTILRGFSVGLISTVPALIGIASATVISFFVGTKIMPSDTLAGGLYGVAMAAVGMLSITGMIVSSDAYGPIVDNAAGIAEQSGLGEEVVAVGDKLDAAGNTAKAITKGFAIGAAALTVLALFAAFGDIVSEITEYSFNIQLLNPLVICGMFVGALMPCFFSARLIGGVESCAGLMIENIRKQFKENPGILEGTSKPDYRSPIDIATKGALKELLWPSIIIIAVTLGVGLLLGVNALAGFLAGAIITGIVFALLMANSGGAWDNAKKYIEEGAYGGKGSEAHSAGVVGDTVGDPFKDTAGPSLNTLITVMSLAASLFAPLFIKLAGISLQVLF